MDKSWIGDDIENEDSANEREILNQGDLVLDRLTINLSLLSNNPSSLIVSDANRGVGSDTKNYFTGIVIPHVIEVVKSTIATDGYFLATDLMELIQSSFLNLFPYSISHLHSFVFTYAQYILPCIDVLIKDQDKRNYAIFLYSYEYYKKRDLYPAPLIPLLQNMDHLKTEEHAFRAWQLDNPGLLRALRAIPELKSPDYPEFDVFKSWIDKNLNLVTLDKDYKPGESK